MKRTFINSVSIISVSVILLCGCISRDSNPGKIKIGILYPLTGELAEKGLDSTRGIQLAVDEINNSGGIKSLKGAKLEPVISDTEGDPETGAAETERLIKESGVSVIIGTYQSSVTKPATRIAEKYKTPFIVSISLADIITERGFRYTFRLEPKAESYCRDQVRFLLDLKRTAGYSVKRVALLHENSDFGTSTSFAQKRMLREHGLNLVADVSYKAEGLKDLSKEIQTVLASKPDAILAVTYLKDSIIIVKTLKRLNTGIPFIDTAGGTVSPEFIAVLGRSAEDILTSAEFSKYTESGKKLNERFHARFGVDITGDSAYAYQSVLVLKDALERAASTGREKIRAALASTDMQKGESIVIPAERIKFNKDGQNEAARLFIVQIRDGEYIPVWPDEYAGAKVRLKR